jgi:hypothetical protein
VEAVLGEDAVGDERVEVEVELQRGSEPLHEGDRAALALGTLLAGTAAVKGEEGAQEDRQSGADKAPTDQGLYGRGLQGMPTQPLEFWGWHTETWAATHSSLHAANSDPG